MDLIDAGTYWVGQYPTSTDLGDLAEPFRSGVRAFLADLRSKGCTVQIRATYRPPERAYLMQVAWDIAHGALLPENVVPHDPPIPIRWTVEGARAMVAAYDLAVRPAGTASRHCVRKAIDMTIHGWPPGKTAERELWALGAKYGAIKLKTDPPHWSSDGH